MKVAYVIYPDFTALDLIGPYEVISRWPEAEIHFLASSSGPVKTDNGLTVMATDTPDTLPNPDLIVVPGSGNPLPVLEDEVLLAWLAKAAPGCRWTVSVCTGASLYAAVGLLDGKKTTTHWAFRDVVGALGPEVVEDRIVWEGNHISGAGVSAGIDVALTLTERVHGRELAEALQLVIEYDPDPPFDAGSLSKASRETRRLAEQVMLAGRSRLGLMVRGARTIIKSRRRKRALGRGGAGLQRTERLTA